MNIFEGKDILVTGGCGSIGSEIVRQVLRQNPKKVRIFDNNETGHWRLDHEIQSPKIRHLIGDVRDKSRLNWAMEQVDYVFHAAALKHVPLCEFNPFEAVHTNVIGTQNVVEVAVQRGVQNLISISTDKAVNPINTMGATKLLGERIVVSATFGLMDTRFSCVRFGNVLGSQGSVIPLFKEQIAKGGPVTVTTAEMTRFFMTISEAVKLVLQSAEAMKGREIFVLKMDIVKILELAEVMIEELAPVHGYKPSDIRIEFIGKRPGEKTHELLFTEEEAPYISEEKDMFVIRNSPLDPNRKENPDWQKVIERGAGRLIGKEEIRERLRSGRYL